METYNFDEQIPRRGTDSVKWDEFEADALPMWVADMDFRTAPAILDALRRRLEHGVFGYELVPQSYYDAVSDWFDRRHGWKGITRAQLVPTTGVIAAYSACIKAMSRPGDQVIVQTPCYNAFFPAIRNNQCTESHNTLVYKDGRYSIDFSDLERKAADPRSTVLLLCNPHNPAGRVWTREELERIGRICLEHGVFVIADEIHCELTYPGHDYTPFATLPEEIVRNSASCISPTKAFNIAGIQIANVFASDPAVLQKVDRAINDNECCDVNVFGCAALEAAYNRSEDWLDALRKYLYDNYLTVCDFLARELPEVTALPLEGTYLMWLDCRAARREGEPLEGFSERFADHLRYNAKLILSTGTIYGADGEGFERLNIACPRERLLDGLERLRKGVRTYARPDRG
ncbi:MAG: pyridoxal phosphate-dependent aminotransferase [Bacteroidales bacterium]|nr:pyridoxal phosphate-dependent aminotransferase [Bacteroidales bacterium]